MLLLKNVDFCQGPRAPVLLFFFSFSFEIASMNTEDVVSPMGPKNQSILWAHCPNASRCAQEREQYLLAAHWQLREQHYGEPIDLLRCNLVWQSEHVHCPLPITRLLAPASRSCCMLYAPHLQDTIVSHFSEPNWKVRRHNSHNCTCPGSTATVTKPFR